MRLIDADAMESELLGLGFQSDDGNVYLGDVLDALSNAPTIDSIPIVHGKWKKINHFSIHEVKCSVCEVYCDWNYNYCPNCGARMDGDLGAID